MTKTYSFDIERFNLFKQKQHKRNRFALYSTTIIFLLILWASTFSNPDPTSRLILFLYFGLLLLIIRFILNRKIKSRLKWKSLKIEFIPGKNILIRNASQKFHKSEMQYITLSKYGLLLIKRGSSSFVSNSNLNKDESNCYIPVEMGDFDLLIEDLKNDGWF